MSERTTLEQAAKAPVEVNKKDNPKISQSKIASSNLQELHDKITSYYKRGDLAKDLK